MAEVEKKICPACKTKADGKKNKARGCPSCNTAMIPEAEAKKEETAEKKEKEKGGKKGKK